MGHVATDSTGTLSVDDGGGVLTVDGTVTANLSATDNAVLDNIHTAVDTVAAAVTTAIQNDIVAARLAGTNAHAKLSPQSGVALDALDVVSRPPPTATDRCRAGRQAASPCVRRPRDAPD